MKLHKHFLEQDLKEASREFHCSKDLLIEIDKKLKEGNIEKAKLLSIDLTKSLHELTKLSERKYRFDSMERLVEEMGITNVMLLGGIKNE